MPGLLWPIISQENWNFASTMQSNSLRNQLVLERNLHTNGKRVTGDFAVKLFEAQTGEFLTPVRSWKTRYMPDNIEKQYGKVAIDMFRSTVTAAIQMHAAMKTEGFVNGESTDVSIVKNT